MPWKETNVLEERMKFISSYLDGEWTMVELCRAFNISRKTGYKWLDRYRNQGLDGLHDESRAPLSHMNQTPDDVVELLLACRKDHPRWGPKKLIPALEKRYPGIRCPAKSTAGDILKRHGMVRPRRRRRRATPATKPFKHVTDPNDVWAVDFKGSFRVGDGRRCQPLTVTDSLSRFALLSKALSNQRADTVKPRFEALFKERGMPYRIRSDNGAPFASVGLGGLTSLSAWWLKLGIRLERIKPGNPQENARHERFHWTLKQETAMPPRASIRAQQVAFTKFLREYNYDRPHESLGDKTPGEFYCESERIYPGRAPEPEYPGHFEVRRVKRNGFIKWHNEFVYLTEALCRETIGLEQISDRHYRVFFCDLELGLLDWDTRKLLRNKVLRYRESNQKGGKDG